MRSRCPDGERGTVTAELAVAVPAVVLVLAACLGGVRVGTERLRAVDAAAQAARVAARGQEVAARGQEGAAGAAAAAGGARLRTLRHDGDLVCADVASDVPLLGVAVPVTASSCALAPALP